MNKNNTFLSIMFFYCISSLAQWSIDPLNPLVFCDATGNQSELMTVEDGDGGMFAFWLDDRTGTETTQVYGQHFDASGNILWEPNGKLILESPGDIQKFKAYHYDDDKLILVWYNGAAAVNSDNKLSVRQIDDNGEQVWAQDAVIAHVVTEPNTSIWYFVEFDLVRDDFGFHIGFLVANGGGYQYRLSRFTDTGQPTVALHGLAFAGNLNGIVRMTGDSNNHAFLYRPSGNGLGADLSCKMIDTLATPVSNFWSNWITVTDPAGLGYSYDAIADEGGITFLWEGENTIKTTRIDTAGVFVWGNTPKIICTASGYEIDFQFKKNGGDYYAVWKDSRPGIVGNHAIYGQRFNSAGEMQWSETGAEIANMSTFNPFVKFAFDEDNNLVVCHATNLGLRKHVISDLGVQIIGGDGEDALTGAIQPNANDFEMLSLGDHIILSGLKYNFNDTNLFLTCVDGCQITMITENVSACDEYSFNGTTYFESGAYEIVLPGDSILTLNLTINSPIASVVLSGDTLISDISSGNYFWWNCDTQSTVTDGNYLFLPTETGNYAFILELNGCTDTTDCYFVDIVGVQNLKSQIAFECYPNPGSEVLVLRSASSFKNVQIIVYDSTGNEVYEKNNVTGTSSRINTSAWTSGLYHIAVVDGLSREIHHWCKQ